MLYTMKELASLDVDALSRDDKTVCKVCSEPMHENAIDQTDKPVCDYCSLSEVIEQHPIGLPK